MKLVISKSNILALCCAIVALTLMAGLAISKDENGVRYPMEASRRYSTFENPTIKHPRTGVFYRLDWCYNWAKACGQDAANAFCKALGYAKAKEFEMDADIGNRTPTLVMGDQRLCTESFCDGFAYITCSD